MMPPITPEQEIFELRQLLEDSYTAMVMAGWCGDRDKLMQRIKDKLRQSNKGAVHSKPLGMPNDQ